MAQVEYVFRYQLKEQGDGRWSAECLDLPGCHTYGDDQDHALERIKDAIVGLVEVYERDGRPVPAFMTGAAKPRRKHRHHPAAWQKVGDSGKTLDGLLTA